MEIFDHLAKHLIERIPEHRLLHNTWLIIIQIDLIDLIMGVYGLNHHKAVLVICNKCIGNNTHMTW